MIIVVRKQYTWEKHKIVQRPHLLQKWGITHVGKSVLYWFSTRDVISNVKNCLVMLLMSHNACVSTRH